MNDRCSPLPPTYWRRLPRRLLAQTTPILLCAALAVSITGCRDGTGEPDVSATGIAAGLYHTLVVKDDGSLWGCGDNTYGKLGVTTTTTNQTTLVEIMSGDVAAVAAGHHHSLVVKDDGSLWGCGYNDRGQLGDGSTTTRSAPVEIATDVAAVTAGIEHSMALKTDGTLWAWGGSTYGQVGPGASEDPQKTPAQVTGITGTIEAIETGGWHSLALTADGTLYAWGRNHVGQLGNGSTTSQTTPVAVATGVAAVSAGQAYTLILKTDGSVWGCGENNQGQLCADTTTTTYTSDFVELVDSGVESIAAGGWSCAAIKTDGTIVTWGMGEHGQLGNGTNTAKQTSPVTVSSLTAAGGAIVGGGYHFIARTAEGDCWVWGLQQYGELGNGVGDGATVSGQNVPVELGL